MLAHENPFASHRILQVRHMLQDVTEAQLFQRLEALDYRGAIVGPESSGKTTLLEDLQPPLEAKGYICHFLRLNLEKRCFSHAEMAEIAQNSTKDTIFLFDGAEQLGFWRWKSFRRKSRLAGGLIITSHRPGLLPTLLECRGSLEILQVILGRLDPEMPEKLRQRASKLYSLRQGNIREVLRDYYEIYADL
ncbi:MAG: hypothetical protein ACLFQ6_12680 [Candidatus Sumerlaeia bacterium]